MNELGDEEEWQKVLTEFHRAASSSMATGIPPPAEVTSSVATLHMTEFPQQVAAPPKQVVKEGVKIFPETEFNFGQNHYVAPGGHTSFTLDMQLSCHNQGALPLSPLAIGVVPNKAYWFTAPPPGGPPATSGFLTFRWDYSNWWPARYGQPPTIARATIGFVTLPAVSPYYIHVEFTLRNAYTPYDWVRTLFYVGERPDVWRVHNEQFPAQLNGQWGAY